MAVISDSAADLPADVAARTGIVVVPLTVVFGSEAFLDGVTLSAEAFWDRTARDPEFPTTASPSPAEFAEAYRGAAARGARGVVSVHVSGALSRTVETARLAAAESPVPVEVVDSRSVSLGIGLVALAAARAAAAGDGLDGVAGVARAAARRTAVFALLDTVEFLRRGGRLGRAKAAVTDLLRIRPVLTLEDGEPVLAARARTRAKAVAEILARVDGPAEAAGVIHAGAPEAAEVARSVAKACGAEPIVSLVGAVTGTHLGPRALGVALLSPGGPGEPTQ